MVHERIPDTIKVRLKINDVPILLGLAEGLKNEEIAKTLDGSPLTVKQVENRILWLRKIFGCKTTTQLVAKAYHYGLLKAPDDTSEIQ